MSIADNSTDTYDSLLSYEGGSDFFEAVLGGLACIDSDSDNDSIISSGSSSDPESDSESEEQSPLFEKSQTSGFNESDKESIMSEESPLINTAEAEANSKSDMEIDTDSIFIETPIKKNSDDVKNLIKEMLKSL